MPYLDFVAGEATGVGRTARTTTEHQLEWRHTSAAVHVVVVRVCRRRYISIPVLLVFLNVSAGHFQDYAILTVELPIGLGIISRGIGLTRPEQLVDALKEAGGNLLAVVRKD